MPTILTRPQQPIRRVLQWRTDVITAYDGSEQRIAWMDLPRQTVTLTYALDTLAEVREIRTILFRQLDDRWTIPTWWWPDVTTSSVTSPDRTWDFNADGESLIAVGDSFLAIAPDGTQETFSVDALTATEITASAAPTAGTFPAGTELYRLVGCTVKDQPSVERFRAGPEVVSLEFELPIEALSGAALDSFTPEVGAGETLKLMTPGTTANGTAIPLADPSSSYAAHAMLERIDYGGVVSQFTSSDHASFVEQRTYHARRRTGIGKLDSFFSTVVGARDPWYAPTYRADLVVDTQPSSPWTSFLVADESDTVADTFDYAGQWWTKAGYRQIRIKTSAGVELYRTVTSVTDNADGTITINVLPALPTSTVISEISFLEVVRLASDAVTYEHTGWDATCRIVTKAVTSDDSAAV